MVVYIFIELQFGFLLEDYCVTRTSYLEMPNVLSLLYLFSYLDITLATWNIGHTDVHQTNFTYFFIFRINYDYPSRGDRWQKTLGYFKRIQLFRSELRSIYHIVTLNQVISFNLAIDWRMPPMIVEGIKKALIDGPSFEKLAIVLTLPPRSSKDVLEWVILILQPKCILYLYICHWHRRRFNCKGFTWINYDIFF